jgi:midasin
MAAMMRGQKLHIINCNQHTETSDFLGGFRPVRDRERFTTMMHEAAAVVVGSPLWAAAGEQPPVIPNSADVNGLQLHHTIQTAAASAGRLLGNTDSRGEAETQMEAAIDAMLSAAREVRAPFTWSDGPLITAMRCGDCILIDEINLADDAVLERLNSVLEPGRTITLAEKGGKTAEVALCF